MIGKTAAQLVAEAKGRIRNLSPDEVAAAMDDGGATLIDIREPEELAANGKIAGAVHAPRGMIEFYADPTSAYYRPEFDATRPIILSCASGGRSALAVETLTAMGYRDVAHLDGGLKAWRERGLPVRTA